LTDLQALDAAALNSTTYQRACVTEGYFSEGEARLLIRAIQSAGSSPTYVEIGSFRGRSTLFALSALPPGGRVVAVDAFIYAEHSPAELRTTLDDPRVTVLEGTIAMNWTALADARPSVVLIDGDHSFAGVVLDLAFMIGLCPVGVLVATHDVSDRFPGVQAAVEAFAAAGAIRHVESADDLALWEIVGRPAWLIDPRPELRTDLPDDARRWVPEIVSLSGHPGSETERTQDS
jgi:predicted O-methyltransferase YrrM